MAPHAHQRRLPADSVQNLALNTLFDGLFHAATWVAVAVGLLLLHRAIRQGAPWSGTRLIGSMAMGWGSFNLVEGVIDHHVLGLHHVKESATNPFLWDVGFLVFGAVLVIVGILLARPGAPQASG